MEKHVIKEAPDTSKEAGRAEGSSAEKSIHERALEALLGCTGEDMLVRAKELNALLGKIEKGGDADGSASDAAS